MNYILFTDWSVAIIIQQGDGVGLNELVMRHDLVTGTKNSNFNTRNTSHNSTKILIFLILFVFQRRGGGLI